MMNQTNSGFLNSIPPVTKNLIIINLLFCNATFFFVENLFADVFDAAQNAESE